jgi:hypothetical protein
MLRICGVKWKICIVVYSDVVSGWFGQQLDAVFLTSPHQCQVPNMYRCCGITDAFRVPASFVLCTWTMRPHGTSTCPHHTL